MTTNHTPTDALVYLAARITRTIEWATDAIAGNIPIPGDTFDTLAERNETPLDALSDLIGEIREIVAQHTTGTHYSDGRPVHSTVELPAQNTRFVHLWPADPTTATEQHIEVDGYGTRSVVTITPPSSIRVETIRTLAVVREAEENRP